MSTVGTRRNSSGSCAPTPRVTSVVMTSGGVVLGPSLFLYSYLDVQKIVSISRSQFLYQRTRMYKANQPLINTLPLTMIARASRGTNK